MRRRECPSSADLRRRVGCQSNCLLLLREKCSKRDTKGQATEVKSHGHEKYNS
ncbi:Uncharacterized protein DAT39_016473 [Clarias magur]|uniref:Uncharacterized protein n=1 Tax=Clarias magur TaxID=1594786 RepID=A0A8J4UCR0_CLAMG|nr:Uncharacterized protein DAT39_016473 [Clarias magur]